MINDDKQLMMSLTRERNLFVSEIKTSLISTLAVFSTVLLVFPFCFVLAQRIMLGDYFSCALAIGFVPALFSLLGVIIVFVCSLFLNHNSKYFSISSSSIAFFIAFLISISVYDIKLVFIPYVVSTGLNSTWPILASIFAGCLFFHLYRKMIGRRVHLLTLDSRASD